MAKNKSTKGSKDVEHKLVIDARDVTNPAVGHEATTSVTSNTKTTQTFTVGANGHTTYQIKNTTTFGSGSTTQSHTTSSDGESTNRSDTQYGNDKIKVGHTYKSTTNSEDGSGSSSETISVSRKFGDDDKNLTFKIDVATEGDAYKPMALDPNDLMHTKNYLESGGDVKTQGNSGFIKVKGPGANLHIGSRSDVVLDLGGDGKPVELHSDITGSVDVDIGGFGYSSESLAEKGSSDIAKASNSLDNKIDSLKVNLELAAPDSDLYKATVENIEAAEQSKVSLAFFEANAVAREAEASIDSGNGDWTKVTDESSGITTYKNPETGQVLSVDRKNDAFTYKNTEGEVSNISYEGGIQTSSEIIADAEELKSNTVGDGKERGLSNPDDTDYGETSEDDYLRIKVHPDNTDVEDMDLSDDVDMHLVYVDDVDPELMGEDGAGQPLTPDELKEQMRQAEESKPQAFIDEDGDGRPDELEESLSERPEIEKNNDEGAAENEQGTIKQLAKDGKANAIDASNKVTSDALNEISEHLAKGDLGVSDMGEEYADYDADGDGYIEADEKANLLKAQTYMSDEAIAEAAQGTSQEDFMATLNKMQEAKANHDGLSNHLKGFDSDKNGLDDTEINSAYAAAGMEIKNGLVGLIDGFETDNDALAFVSVLNTAIGGDHFQQTWNQDKHGSSESWFGDAENEVAGGAQIVNGLLGLDNALENDNVVGVLSSSVAILDGINTFTNDTGAGGVFGEGVGKIEIGGTGVNVGQALSVVNFVMAVDSGDPVSIATSGAQVYTAFTGNSIPGLGYVGAVTQLLDGDVEGAAISAASTYLMTLGPWGVAAGIVLSLVAPSPPPPLATAEFVRNPDGSLGVKVTGNNDDFKESVEETADAYADYFNQFEQSLPDDRRIDTNLFPEYEMTQDKEGNNSSYMKYNFSNGQFGDAQNIITEDTDQGAMLFATAVTNVGLQMLMDGSAGHDITGWDEAAWADQAAMDKNQSMLVYGKELEGAFSGSNLSGDEFYQNLHEGVFNELNQGMTRPRQSAADFFASLEVGVEYSVYPFGAPPSEELLNRVTGTGQFNGGEQRGGNRELVTAGAGDITTAPGWRPPTVQQQLGEVSQSWRMNASGLFDGERGRLLASALATGAISYAQLVEAGILVDPEQAPQVNEANEAIFADLLDQHGEVLAAGNPQGNQDWFQSVPNFDNGELNEAYIDGYVPLDRRPDLFLDAEAGQNAVIAEPEASRNPADELAESIRLAEQVQSSSQRPDLNDLNVQIVDGEVVVQQTTDSGEVVELERITLKKDPVLNFGQSDTFTMLEDRHLYTNVDELLANDSSGVEFVGLLGANKGSVSLGANNQVKFVPDANFFGLASFDYQVQLNGDVQTVTSYVYVANTDDTPIAADDNFTFGEDTAVKLTDLLANDIELDKESLSVASVSQVSVGRVEVDSSGEYWYIPKQDYVGSVELVYRVQDTAGSSGIARANIEFTQNENDAPIVTHDELSGGTEDTDYTFNVSSLIANDVDTEGGNLTVTQVAAVSGGSLVWNDATGEVTFTPDANFNGDAQIKYTVADDSASPMSAEGTANIYFAPVADTFTTNNHSVTVNDSTVTVIQPDFFFAGVTNEDNLPLKITAVRMVNGESGALVRLLPDGSVQLVSETDYVGDTAFEVRISNGDQRIVSRVDVTVLDGNDAPTANNDAFTNAVEDTVYTLNQADLLANDSDKEGDAFTITDIRLNDATQGSLHWDNSTGEIKITPDDNFNGNLLFSYTLTETASGNTATGSAKVVFAASNDTATLTDKSVTVDEKVTTILTKDALLDVLVDTDGEALSISSALMVNAPDGSVSVNAQGDVVFTPDNNFNGDTQLTLTVTDGVTNTNLTVDVSVKDLNDAPVITNDVLNGAVEDQVYQFTVQDLLANDSDDDGDALNVKSVSLQDASNGTLEFDKSKGELVFTPADDFNGDVVFEYTVAEAGSDNTVTGSARIIVAAVDDVPTVSNRSFDVDSQDDVVIFTKQMLLGAMTDADGESINITDVRLTNASDGTIQILANGDVQFSRAANLAGANHLSGFEFDVSDGVSTLTANASLNLSSLNDAPEAGAEVVFNDATEETNYQFNVSALLAGASDEEGHAITIQSLSLNNPDQGQLTWNQDTGDVTIIPSQDVFGEVKINYVLQDELGAQTNSVATVVFANTNDTAELENQDYTKAEFNIAEDETKIFTKEALLNGILVDQDGESLSISNVTISSAEGSTVTLNSDQSVTLTPAANHTTDIESETGDVVLAVEVTDGVSPQTIEVMVRVWPENDAPTVSDDNVSMQEDTSHVFMQADLLANDSDLENNNFAIVGIWATSSGNASFNTDTGELTYNPEKDAFGSQWVDYIVRDELGAWSVSRLKVEVQNSDDPIQAHDDVLESNEDVEHVFLAPELLANDDNPDAETLTIVSIDSSSITNGTLMLQGNEIRYQPAANYNGTQTFTYTVEDESGNQSTATATLHTKNVNDAPEVSLATDVSAEDAVLSLSFNNLLSNATDQDDDWMSVVGVRTTDGAVTIDEKNQKIEFTPTLNFNSFLAGRPAEIEYLVVDENGAETWAKVEVDVTPENDLPVANDDAIAVWESGPGGYVNTFNQTQLFANDQEFDGEALDLVSVTPGGGNGAVSFDDNSGVVSYQASNGFVGAATFTYEVGDGVPNSTDTAQVTVQVFDNTGPEAHDFVTNGAEDTVLVFDSVQDILPHVTDVDLNNSMGLPEQLKLVGVSNARHGTVSMDANGRVIFQPDQNFNSENGVNAQFDFTVEDIVGNQSTATANIVYSSVNDAPVAADDVINVSIDEDTPTGLRFNIADLAANDYDVDDPNSAFGQFTGRVIGADNGRIVDEGGGNYRYIPNRNYHGTDTIRYEIQDGGGLTAQATAQVTVNSVNDAPLVQFDTVEFTGAEYSVSLSQLLRNDSDADGDRLYISNPSSTTATNISISGGMMHFTAMHPDQMGSIQYEVSDGTDKVTSILYFTGHNTAPTLDQHYKDTWRTGNLLFKDDFAADSTVTVQLVSHNSNKELAFVSSEGQNGRYYVNNETAYGRDVTGTFSATDIHGAVTFVTLKLIDFATLNYNPADPYYAHWSYSPIILDLDGDGIETENAAEGEAAYDVDHDGIVEKTSWVSNGDALLAFDANNDGIINRTEEIAFTGYVAGAKTDLEGLHFFDSNGDGVLSANDELWDRFGAWSDDGDGEFEEGEWQTLEEAGITEIILESDEEEVDLGDAGKLHGTGVFVKEDGTTGVFGDAEFSYIDEDDDGSEVTESDYSTDQDESDSDSSVAASDNGDETESSSERPDAADENSDTDINDAEASETGNDVDSGDKEVANQDSKDQKSDDSSDETTSQSESESKKSDSDDSENKDDVETTASSESGDEEQSEKTSSDQADDEWPTDEKVDEDAAATNQQIASEDPSEDLNGSSGEEVNTPSSDDATSDDESVPLAATG